MAVKVGSARIDENGHAKGGKAGKQKAIEISSQNWYKHPKGWIVIRPINGLAAEKIAQDMEFAIKNKNIGYDQGQRLTLYNIAKHFDFNCKLVNDPCETDCSALVRVCCAYAGIETKSFRTSNEVSVLMATGKFIKLTDKKYTDSSNYLMRGDILVTKTQGHTVVVLNDGIYAQPRHDDLTIKSILVTAMSLNVRDKPHGVSIGFAYRGNTFPYIDTDRESGWYKIKYKETTGYITDKYTVPIYE